MIFLLALVPAVGFGRLAERKIRNALPTYPVRWFHLRARIDEAFYPPETVPES